MDSRPVFVLLTAKPCAACVRFKHSTWKSLKEEIEKIGKVQVIEIEVPTITSKPDPTKYHKDLKRFIGWWPTMSLYPAQLWYDRNSELVGVIKNGKQVPPGIKKDQNGKPVMDPNTGKPIMLPERVVPATDPKDISLDPDDILNWIDYTLKHHRIFKKYVPIQGNHNGNQSMNPPQNMNPSQSMNLNPGMNPSQSMNNNNNYRITTSVSYFKASKVE